MNARTNTNETIDLRTVRHTGDFGRVWDSLDGPIFRVLDEEGNNVADCRVRHLLGTSWLCVDDMDGYALLEESAVENLILSAE